VPAYFFSRVSHKTVRRRCNILRFSTCIFRSQLRWLGHIFRKFPDHLSDLFCSNRILTSNPAVPSPMTVSVRPFTVAPIWIGGKNFCVRYTAMAATPERKLQNLHKTGANFTSSLSAHATSIIKGNEPVLDVIFRL